MNHGTKGRTLAAAFALAWCVEAQALLIDFTPAVGIHAVGSAFSVAVRLSGMPGGQALTGYDFDIGFDPTLLSLSSVSESNALCDQSAGSQCQGHGTSLFLATPGSGVVNLRDLSLASDAQLLGQQGNPLTLFLLTFIALAEGTSTLGFTSANGLSGVLDAQTGFATDLMLLGPAFGNGSVTITAAQVPEPGTWALLAVALALLARRPSRSRRSGDAAVGQRLYS